MGAIDWKRAIGNWAVGVGLLAFAPPANAQVPEAVYEDAKDIIEELLTTEVAHEVAPGIACLSGRRSAQPNADGAISYAFTGADGQRVAKWVHLEATTHYPKTLQLVFNRQFGRLRGTLRDESGNLAGYLVYQALHAAALRAAADRAQSGTDATTPEAVQKARDLAVEAMALAATAVGKAVQDCPTDPDDASTVAPGSACRDTAASSSSAVQFGGLSPAELTACKDAVKQGLEGGAWGQRSTYSLDDECNGAETDRVECHLAQAVRSGVLNQPAAAEDSLIKTTALVLRTVATKTYPSGPPPGAPAAKVLDAIERQVLFLLRKVLSEDTWETKPLEERLAAILQSAESLGDSRPTDEARTALVRRLASGLEQIHATWRSAVNVGTGKLDVLAFLRSVGAEQGPLGTLCAGETANACAVIARLPLISKPGPHAKGSLEKLLYEVRPFIAYAARGEHAEAAQVGIAYVFQKIGTSNHVDVSVHQRFVQSVAGYVLDAAEGDAPSETARVAFRKASVEMIQHLGRGTGIRRRYATLGSALKIFFLPDMALRASWSGSYVNDGTTAARILASANWLNVRFRIQRTEASYVGLEVSALDPLAPLSELALRRTDQTHYARTPRAFLNVVTPRIDLLAASPMLSEHLAVSAGLSLRLVAPMENGVPRADGRAGYHYVSFHHAKDGNGRSLWPQFLEFGFAVKYLL
jgi:hypothetical protein